MKEKGKLKKSVLYKKRLIKDKKKDLKIFETCIKKKKSQEKKGGHKKKKIRKF